MKERSLAETTYSYSASVTSPKVVNSSENGQSSDITTPVDRTPRNNGLTDNEQSPATSMASSVFDEKNKITSTSVSASGLASSMKSDIYSKPESIEDDETCFQQRDPKYLDRNLFDPVWVPGDDHLSGDFPEELHQLVGLGEGLQIAGSLRSLFWVAGMDDAINIIDDPTRKLEDRLEAVPLGTSIAGFLINRYVEEQLLPASFHQKLLGFEYDALQPPRTLYVQTATIPSAVTEMPATVDLHSLYPWHRQQCFPRSVRVLKIKHKKDEQTWVTDAKHENDDFLAGDGLLFRGVSLYGLEQCLSFFMPVFNGVNHTNEFGPGIYVTPSLAYAKRYAGRKGAVLVFRSPDLRNLVTWEPAIVDWKLLVAHHLGLKHRPEVPAEFESADAIIGPVSRRLRMSSEGDLQQSSDIQHAYASYRACERLAASLQGIVYIS